jgi:ribonuclease HI/exonuclease III
MTSQEVCGGLGRCDTYIPHPCITTHNIASLSQHAHDAKGAARRQRKLNHIDRLLGSCDILCLQETNLGKHDSTALATHFKTHRPFHNNLSLGKAGTMVLVSTKVQRMYHIQPIPLPEAQDGRVQVIRFTSKAHPTIAEASFTLVNVYLPANGLNAGKIGHLSTLLRPHIKRRLKGRIFMCGDFNFITEAGDATNPHASIRLGKTDKVEWERVEHGLGLREIKQDTHTHFALTQEVSHTRSSRIDRIYTSLTDAELSVIAASAEISFAGASNIEMADKMVNVLQDIQKPGLKATFRRLHVSDHLPVTLRFFPLAPSKKRAFNAPQHLGSKESIAKCTKENWTGYSSGKGFCPFEAMANWKAATTGSVKEHFAEAKATKARRTDSMTRLTGAVALMRACTRPKQDAQHIRKLLRTHPHLTAHITLGDRYELDGLSEHIDGLLSNAAVAAADKEVAQQDTDHIEIYLPPSYLPGGQRGGQDPVSQIKERLPMVRARLTALRERTGDPLSNVPQRMGDIIVRHYTEVWKRNAEGASGPTVQAYIKKVTGLRRIPPELQPTLPDMDDMIDIINASNDSCAGPDGIPFSYYKAYIRLDTSLALVLADIAKRLGAGVVPPTGYNHARFFLIPKKAGGLIADTRGISVSNADNRLVASAIVKAITPALQGCIHPDQKGFVPGRIGTEHGHKLTNSFYAALSRKQQRYILLLDTKRAFDTLSHTFIHTCIAAMGFAGWFCRCVAGLLHDVVVIPVLAEVTKHRIKIERGVKQGCPLSPLLFAICFDILLLQLHAISSITKYAYADDLALDLRSITAMIEALALVREFGTFSDLHTNQKKTHLVSTLPPSEGTITRLARAGWDEIEFVESAVYLGILFGRGITEVDIFAAAHRKFNTRMGKYSSVIKNSSIKDRIVIFNVFLFPLFYYLAQFYVIPYEEIVRKVKTATHRAVVAFNGGGMSYPHIIAPRGTGFGPHTPLKDLWATNMTLLGWGFDMEASHLAAEVVMGEYSQVIKWNHKSLRPVEHMAYGAFVFLYSYAPRTHQLLDLARAPPIKAGPRRRRWMYDLLASKGYWVERDSLSQKASLPRKLAKFTGAPCSLVAARNVCAHARKASTHVSPASWNTQLRLIMNALPFEKRRLDAGMRASLPRRHTRCYFCHQAEDSATHVFKCPVVCAARKQVGERAGCKLRDGLDQTALAFPPCDSPLPTLLTFAFNWSVWRTRSDFFATLGFQCEFQRAVNHITAHTLCHFDPNDDGPSIAESKLVALANQPPPNVAICFTDGSRQEDGEAGAGYTIRLPGKEDECHADYLGRCDNNEAEMEAILRTLRRLLELHREGWSGPAMIFSDSAGCLGYLLVGWGIKVRPAMAREARRLFNKAKDLFTLRLYWIRGHAGIAGNEKADKLANKGAKAKGGGRRCKPPTCAGAGPRTQAVPPPPNLLVTPPPPPRAPARRTSITPPRSKRPAKRRRTKDGTTAGTDLRGRWPAHAGRPHPSRTPSKPAITRIHRTSSTSLAPARRRHKATTTLEA